MRRHFWGKVMLTTGLHCCSGLPSTVASCKSFEGFLSWMEGNYAGTLSLWSDGDDTGTGHCVVGWSLSCSLHVGISLCALAWLVLSCSLLHPDLNQCLLCPTLPWDWPWKGSMLLDSWGSSSASKSGLASSISQSTVREHGTPADRGSSWFRPACVVGLRMSGWVQGSLYWCRVQAKSILGKFDFHLQVDRRGPSSFTGSQSVSIITLSLGLAFRRQPV